MERDPLKEQTTQLYGTNSTPRRMREVTGTTRFDKVQPVRRSAADENRTGLTSPSGEELDGFVGKSPSKGGGGGATPGADNKKGGKEGAFLFETVDWATSADKDVAFRHALDAPRSKHSFSCIPRPVKRWLRHGQGWIVCAIVGFVTALSASFIEVGREWAFDLKLGMCRRGFWNDRHDCCQDSPDELRCEFFSRWGDLMSSNVAVIVFFNHFFFVLIAVLLAVYAAWLIAVYAPLAAGTGIPEMKTIMGGFVMKEFLGYRTLMIKCLGLVLAVGSGLSLDLQGAYVHIACCIGNIFARYFDKFAFSQVKRRELLSAAAAAGISVAFGAPIGGVLFSYEQISSHFPVKTTVRSFFCAIVGVLSLQTLVPLHGGKLVQFTVTYFYNWHWFEFPIFVGLGVIGGVCGSFMLRLINTYSQFRRAAGIDKRPVLEVGVVAFFTAIVNYRHEFMGKDTTAFLAALYSDCSHHGRQMMEDLCVESAGSSEALSLLLLSVCFAKLILTVFGVCVQVPGGHLVPSMAIGACIGRVYGIVIQLIEHEVGDKGYFAECAGDESCIVPGAYAIIGSAALLTSVTRMTLSVVVIMFEVTGGLEYVGPVMLAVMISKWVSDGFGRRNIYDSFIAMNNYPYLDNKMDDVFHDTAADVMQTRNIHVITQAGQTLGSIRETLEKFEYSGFPVVNDYEKMGLVGYISRGNLEAVVARATADIIPEDSPCFFSNELPFPRGRLFLDLTAWMDQSPIEITETSPLNRVIEFFRALRLRYLLVVRNGRLVGIITKRDILRRIDQFRGNANPFAASWILNADMVPSASKLMPDQGL